MKLSRALLAALAASAAAAATSAGAAELYASDPRSPAPVVSPTPRRVVTLPTPTATPVSTPVRWDCLGCGMG